MLTKRNYNNERVNYNDVIQHLEMQFRRGASTHLARYRGKECIEVYGVPSRCGVFFDDEARRFIPCPP